MKQAEYSKEADITQDANNLEKGYQVRTQIDKPNHVSIIGGGIASACLAYELTKQNIEVTLYCKDAKLSQGASSNAIGAIYPLIHQKRDDISLFYQQALFHARKLYQTLATQGYSFDHDWCGLLELSYKHSLEQRQSSIENKDLWPTSLIQGLTPEQASCVSGIKQSFGGLFYPDAGWVSPQSLVSALFKASECTGLLTLKMNTEINAITQKAPLPEKDSSKDSMPHWKLHAKDKTFKTKVLVVCSGADSISLNTVNTLPMSAVRGQISSMKSNVNIAKLSTVICHKGYLTPQNGGVHCIGATFQKNDLSQQPRKEDDRYNLSMLEKCLPSLSKTIDWELNDVISSKARLRCMTPDHLPMVGAMPDIQKHIETYPHLAKDKNWKYSQPAPIIDNLYIMTGFGARGLCSAPLCAKILTADLCSIPYALDNNMLFNLSPNRFVIRDIVKRKLPL
ncbi:MAG: FAD-dependent 5-carboxymethylaminomethyl-2-thiouridine(34) oxidoreductase MnmC [Colwellia sp.]